jgi:hypothetical protein
MNDPILTKIEKCLVAWEVFRASGQREPLPLYCYEHDKWQRQHDEVTADWRDAWRDALATVPTTRQGAISLIDAFLLQDTDRGHYAELLALLKAFLQTLSPSVQ